MAKEKEKFESYVSAVMKQYGAAGMAVSVFSRDSTIYQKFFGYRDLERKEKIDENTIFGMASLSKSFTALSIMKMAEDGNISLWDPVPIYIPELSDNRIRISHLLAHSAGYFPLKRILAREIAESLGIFYETDGPLRGKIRELAGDSLLAKKGLELVCARLNRQERRLGEPGEYMSYSNDGYGILSEIIHLYGGLDSYKEYLETNIFKPLGMKRTFCGFVAPAEDENCTELYIHRGNMLEHSRDFYDNAFVLMGGGAVKSTIQDMKQYVRMYLNGGKPVVGGKSIREMYKPREEYHYGQWYGYGLTTKQMDGLTVIGHGGSLTGISNYMAWEPHLGIGVLVFCNTTGVPAVRVAEMALRWTAGFDPDIPNRKSNHPWDSEMIRRAVGVYRSEEGNTVKLADENGHVCIEINGQPATCQMFLPGVLEVKLPLASDDLMLLEDENGAVFGMRFRGRVLPRAESTNLGQGGME